MSQVQIIKCKCGKTFAGCRVPECYTEKDWQKDLRKYVLRGCTVEVVAAGDFRFESCQCEMQVQEKQPQLF